jgi:hypothetical protein
MSTFYECISYGILYGVKGNVLYGGHVCQSVYDLLSATKAILLNFNV